MAIEPFIRCADMSASLHFYTEVMDFDIAQAPDPDPNSFMSMHAFLVRDGCGVHLSAHAGDGVFGNVIYVRVDNIDTLYQQFISNGLNIDKPDDYPAVRIKPVEQTWGMKEFGVTDPDGNKLTFGQAIQRNTEA